ncbi:MAG TPA: helix-turn-helix domain-containing protein [Rhizomicrobium sp.]|jgi:AcrR family transcriptional regulator|nr:helix-turn-helix domain-containing protein [Rhizomicrobium sp.]
MTKSLGFQRRKPKQARARVTVDSILEAAVQVLRQSGGLNTNHVAERAGVSIGTLYQYFPDKESILLAVAKREVEKPETGVQRSLMEALIRALESLLGRGAPRANRPARVSRMRERNASRLVSAVGDVVFGWVTLLLPMPMMTPAVSKRQRVARWM